MTNESEFQEFPKMARLSRECVISEKIDGTNGQIWINDDMTVMRVGSRSRWLATGADNYGFHAWAMEHVSELMQLGPGRHFGEWWGQGIQRNYGLTEKRFSLFNVIRWCLHGQEPRPIPNANGNPKEAPKMQQVLPACVSLVPELYRGVFTTGAVEYQLDVLVTGGSAAAPGFMKPEGVVVYHMAAGVGFKKTIEKDEQPKGMR
jgi:hypothetical protein